VVFASHRVDHDAFLACRFVFSRPTCLLGAGRCATRARAARPRPVLRLSAARSIAPADRPLPRRASATEHRLAQAREQSECPPLAARRHLVGRQTTGLRVTPQPSRNVSSAIGNPDDPTSTTNRIASACSTAPWLRRDLRREGPACLQRRAPIRRYLPSKSRPGAGSASLLTRSL